MPYAQIQQASREWVLQIKTKAEAGNPEAQYLLSQCCFDGNGVEQNDVLGFAWLEEAARGGYTKAQLTLGTVLYQGNGVEIDQSAAYEWLLKAAEQRDPDAQYNIGVCLASGSGVEMNLEAAVHYFEKAALQGITEAQLKLSACYNSGFGVPRDPEKATYWMDKAIAPETAQDATSVSKGIQTSSHSEDQPREKNIQELAVQSVNYTVGTSKKNPNRFYLLCRYITRGCERSFYDFVFFGDEKPSLTEHAEKWWWKRLKHKPEKPEFYRFPQSPQEALQRSNELNTPEFIEIDLNEKYSRVLNVHISSSRGSHVLNQNDLLGVCDANKDHYDDKGEVAIPEWIHIPKLTILPILTLCGLYLLWWSDWGVFAKLLFTPLCIFICGGVYNYCIGFPLSSYLTRKYTGNKM